MLIEEGAYLEHWGVRGMRWGVRNKKKETSNKFSNNSRISRILKSKETKQVAARMGIAALVGLGTTAVVSILVRRGNTPVKEISRTVFEARDSHGNVISKIGDKVDQKTIRALREINLSPSAWEEGLAKIRRMPK